MKQMKLEITLNVSDNVTPGKCESCPIVISTYEEVRYGAGAYKYRCPIGCSSITCPLKEISSNESVIHAKWTTNEYGTRICSNCKNVPQGKEITPWSKYCCHCGAKMDLN